MLITGDVPFSQLFRRLSVLRYDCLRTAEYFNKTVQDRKANTVRRKAAVSSVPGIQGG